MNTFSIGEALKVGWQKTIQSFWLWAGMLLTGAVVNLVFWWIQNQGDSGAVIYVTGLASWVVQLGLTLGVMVVALKLIDNRSAKYADLFGSYSLVGNFFIATLIGSLASLAGLILLVVPGIYIALRLSQAGYLIADKKLGGIEALKASWRITQGNTLQLFFLFTTLWVLNILGALLLLVGLLVTMPISRVATAQVYRRLTAAEHPLR